MTDTSASITRVRSDDSDSASILATVPELPDLPSGRGRTMRLATADTAVAGATALLLMWWRDGHLIAPYGTPGDLPGLVALVSAALLSNWAFGLFQRPPADTKLTWVGRVGLAVTAAVVIIGAFGSLLNRPVVPLAVLWGFLLIFPGALFCIRSLSQLESSMPPDGSPFCGLAPGGGLQINDVGWVSSPPEAANTFNGDLAPAGRSGPWNQSVVVGIRPSILLIHRLDQWAVLLVAPWVLPIAGVLALVQKARGRRLQRVIAPNGATVPAFDLAPNALSQKLGFATLPTLWSTWRGRVSLLDPAASEASLTATRSVRRWPFVIGWIVVLRLFGLGYVTGDTWGHILEGTNVWHRTSWHPLLNGMVFVPSYLLFGSPLLVTASLIGCFWLALWFACRAIERACGYNLTALAVLIAFSPVIFNFLGLLAKDSFGAAGIVLCVSLLMRERVFTSKRELTLLAAGVGAFSAALFNPAVILVVASLLTYTASRAIGSKRKPFLRTCLALVIGFAATAGTIVVEAFWEAHLQVQNSHKEQAIMLFDLTGMSNILGENLLPPGFIPPERVNEYLYSCYDPKSWDSVAPFGQPCPWVAAGDTGHAIWTNGALTEVWKQQVKAHPLAYFKQRVRHMRAFLTTGGKWPTYAEWQIEDFEGNWRIESNRVQNTYTQFYKSFGTRFPFKPITWLMSNLVLFSIFGWRRRRCAPSSWGLLPIATTIGAISFYLSWSVLGLAYDFRYNYPVIWLFFLSLLMLISDLLLPTPTVQESDDDDTSRKTMLNGALQRNE